MEEVEETIVRRFASPLEMSVVARLLHRNIHDAIPVDPQLE
jgi:hypothetical protein